jgi:hypothetical protein
MTPRGQPSAWCRSRPTGAQLSRRPARFVYRSSGGLRSPPALRHTSSSSDDRLSLLTLVCPIPAICVACTSEPDFAGGTPGSVGRGKQHEVAADVARLTLSGNQNILGPACARRCIRLWGGNPVPGQLFAGPRSVAAVHRVVVVEQRRGWLARRYMSDRNEYAPYPKIDVGGLRFGHFPALPVGRLEPLVHQHLIPFNRTVQRLLRGNAQLRQQPAD